MKKIAEYIPGTAGFMLVCAGIIIWLTGDFRKAYIRRADVTAAWSENFIAGLQSGSDISPRTLKLAALYYKNLSSALPALPGPYEAIAYCYAKLGMNQAAERYLEQGRQACPDCFWLSYNSAVLALRNKDKRIAEEHLSRALTVSGERLLQSVIRAPLSRLPQEQRQSLYQQAVLFARQVRGETMKTLVYLRLDRNDPAGARTLAEQAMADPMIDNKTFFLKVLIDQSPASEPDKKLDIVIHPWARTIPIGKEHHF